ncbi:MAG TPA: hypothetical protein VFN36_07095 [Solirubrobacteraceae bacterium]|nr:hypothetical protein [Solirubrobacteraceae bacterium]
MSSPEPVAGAMAYVIVLLLLVAVVWVVSAPLRRGAGAASAEDDAAARASTLRLDLEAERDAKYREIRDAELDHQTGKLSDEDYGEVDASLRAEAIELLHRLDELEDAAEPLADADSGYHDPPR